MAPISAPTADRFQRRRWHRHRQRGRVRFSPLSKKLKDLKALFDQGLISQSDYEAKKAQLLQGL